jgi:arsenate reductase-like glutaredoxin family protein
MTEEAQRQSIEYMRRGTVYTLRMLANQLEKLRQNHLQKVQLKKSATKPGENDYSTLEAQRKNLSKIELDPAIAKQEVNFNKLKSWLAERDIEFAVKDLESGGKLLAYNYRDTDLVREQIKKIISDIRNKPEEVLKDVGKTPADKTFEDDVAEAKIIQRNDVAESRGIKLSPDDSSITVEDILRAEEAAKQNKKGHSVNKPNEKSSPGADTASRDKLKQHFEEHPPVADDAYFKGLMQNVPEEEIGKGLSR